MLISYGALVGKLSPIQYVLLAFVETPLAVLNEWLLLGLLGVGDVGGSLVVHLFGAVFGIAAARVLFKPSQIHSEHQGSIYHSDLFSLVGTVFLWAFWPSFNSVFAVTAPEQTRAVLNTFLALLGSTVTTFLFSQLLNKEVSAFRPPPTPSALIVRGNGSHLARVYGPKRVLIYVVGAESGARP